LHAQLAGRVPLHVFAAKIVGGEPHAPLGVREVGWFEPDKLPSPRSRALETLTELRRAWRNSV